MHLYIPWILNTCLSPASHISGTGNTVRGQKPLPSRSWNSKRGRQTGKTKQKEYSSLDGDKFLSESKRGRGSRRFTSCQIAGFKPVCGNRIAQHVPPPREVGWEMEVGHGQNHPPKESSQTAPAGKPNPSHPQTLTQEPSTSNFNLENFKIPIGH